MAGWGQSIADNSNDVKIAEIAQFSVFSSHFPFSYCQPALSPDADGSSTNIESIVVFTWSLAEPVPELLQSYYSKQ